MLLGSKQMQYLDWNKYIDIIHTCLTYYTMGSVSIYNSLI